MDDRSAIGNPYPKFLFSVTNSFNFQNFDFSILVSGSVGNQAVVLTDRALLTWTGDSMF